jgi:hypothetical protein
VEPAGSGVANVPNAASVRSRFHHRDLPLGPDVGVLFYGPPYTLRHARSRRATGAPRGIGLPAQRSPSVPTSSTRHCRLCVLRALCKNHATSLPLRSRARRTEGAGYCALSCPCRVAFCPVSSTVPGPWPLRVVSAIEPALAVRRVPSPSPSCARQPGADSDAPCLANILHCTRYERLACAPSIERTCRPG